MLIPVPSLARAQVPEASQLARGKSAPLIPAPWCCLAFSSWLVFGRVGQQGVARVAGSVLEPHYDQTHARHHDTV